MRFVILNHQAPQRDETSSSPSLEDHFDLMFATSNSDRLTTFALAQIPALNQTIAFTPLSDHRAEYLTYEGPISDNRGEVTQHATGTWNGDLDGEIELSFASDSKNFPDQKWTLRLDYHSEQLLRSR